jgi:hypothetical protein
MRVAAVMVLRNEADFVEANVRYHRDHGVTDFFVVDNGSTDGTGELLADLAADDPSIRVESDPGLYRQDQTRTRLARQAATAGIDWVVNIDGDEFWWAEGGDLRAVLADTDAGVLRVEVVNYVQARTVLCRSPQALLTVVGRVAEQRGTREDAQRLVESGEIAYVEMAHPVKCISRLTPEIIIHPGAHEIDGVPGPQRDEDRIRCLHAGLRAREVLEKKAEHGERLEQEELPPDISWHIRRWARSVRTGELDAEWAANSWRIDDAGTAVLDLPSGPRTLVHDTLLADALAPYVTSATPARRWRRLLRRG